MYAMRVLTSADTQEALALVRERVEALDAHMPGGTAGVPIRIAAFLGTPPSTGGCVAGFFEDGVLLAVIVLARTGSSYSSRSEEVTLEVVDAVTRASMRNLRLGALLSMWVSDHAARLSPPASQVTPLVHDPRLADYLCQMCAWEKDRHVRDAGRHAIVLRRAAEELRNLDQAITTDPSLLTVLSDSAREANLGQQAPPFLPCAGGR